MEWVVLLDGECTLCSHYGILVARCDTKKMYKYTTQQSEKGKEIMAHCNSQEHNLKSIMLCNVITKEYYIKSTAILKMWLMILPFYLKPICYIGLFMNEWFRDAIYMFVSEHRHEWFGTKPCPFPPKVYRQQVLE